MVKSTTKIKSYKVSYLQDIEVPFIRISGKWLKDIGINVGDRIELINSNNMIILVKQKEQ